MYTMFEKLDCVILTINGFGKMRFMDFRMDIIKFQILKNGVMCTFDMLSIKYCNNIFSYSSCLLFQFETVKTFILGKNVIETVCKTS